MGGEKKKCAEKIQQCLTRLPIPPLFFFAPVIVLAVCYKRVDNFLLRLVLAIEGLFSRDCALSFLRILTMAGNGGGNFVSLRMPS